MIFFLFKFKLVFSWQYFFFKSCFQFFETTKGSGAQKIETDNFTQKNMFAKLSRPHLTLEKLQQACPTQYKCKICSSHIWKSSTWHKYCSKLQNMKFIFHCTGRFSFRASLELKDKEKSSRPNDQDHNHDLQRSSFCWTHLLTLIITNPNVSLPGLFLKKKLAATAIIQWISTLMVLLNALGQGNMVYTSVESLPKADMNSFFNLHTDVSLSLNMYTFDFIVFQRQLGNMVVHHFSCCQEQSLLTRCK